MCRTIPGPADAQVSFSRAREFPSGVITLHSAFGFRISSGPRVSAFGITTLIPPKTSRNPKSSPPRNCLTPPPPPRHRKPPASALRARCRRVASAMLRCCYRIRFVFPWCSLGILLVFLALFCPGSACLPATRPASPDRDQGIGQLHLPLVFPTVHYLPRANKHARIRRGHAELLDV